MVFCSDNSISRSPYTNPSPPPPLLLLPLPLPPQDMFTEVFRALPLAVVIDRKVLVLHGGLFEQVRACWARACGPL